MTDTAQQEMLIDAILKAYHTTRLCDSAAKHILSKPYVQEAFLAIASLPSPPVSVKAETVADQLAHAADLQRIFDMEWDVSMRAINMWQAANPGNDLVWPDKAKLEVWLMDQISIYRNAITKMARAIGANRECATSLDQYNDVCAEVRPILEGLGMVCEEEAYEFIDDEHPASPLTNEPAGVTITDDLARCLLVENNQHEKHLLQWTEGRATNRLDEYIELLKQSRDLLSAAIGERPDHTAGDNWPPKPWHCAHKNSCMRNRQCMYTPCVHGVRSALEGET